jgi:hypothetical protein
MKTTNAKDMEFLKWIILGLWLWGGTASQAQSLAYSEDFEADHSADGTWVVNSVGGFNPVDLYFDYSTVGIPPAPHSAGGSTRGLKMQANLSVPLQQFPSGSSASPLGFGIPEHFEMRWDWWINYNGPLPSGGLGSSQVAGAGFGTAGTSAQAAGARIDSIYVGASGDGFGDADYRIYSPAFQASHQNTSSAYAAPNLLPGGPGPRNNTNPYYRATFPPVSAPPGQLAKFPQQSGMTPGGSAGMAWHDAAIEKNGRIVSYRIDGLLIARIDLSTNGFLGGDKLVFGHFDINGSASLDPNAAFLAFSLVDNIRVIDLCLGDTEPPTIWLSSDLTVPATSPHGEVVYYHVSATDNCPNPVQLECVPSSGSLFPIGVTTVICSAEDAAGNVALGSFTVTVKGAAEQLSDLQGLVEGMYILPGLKNSLLVKLQESSAALSRGEVAATCGTLVAFMAEVRAQAAKREIAQWEADALLADAARIRNVLSCSN